MLPLWENLSDRKWSLCYKVCHSWTEFFFFFWTKHVFGIFFQDLFFCHFLFVCFLSLSLSLSCTIPCCTTMTYDLDYNMINAAAERDLRLSRGNLRINPICVCAVFVARMFHRECELFVNPRSVLFFLYHANCSLLTWLESNFTSGYCRSACNWEEGTHTQKKLWADSTAVIIQYLPFFFFSID